MVEMSFHCVVTSMLLSVQHIPVVLGDIRKTKTVRYYHKIPRYDGIVIVTKF